MIIKHRTATSQNNFKYINLRTHNPIFVLLVCIIIINLQKLLLWHRQSLRRVYRKPIYYDETVVSTIPQLLSQLYHCGCHSSTTAVVTIAPELWNDCDNRSGTSVTIGIVTTVPTWLLPLCLRWQIKSSVSHLSTLI